MSELPKSPSGLALAKRLAAEQAEGDQLSARIIWLLEKLDERILELQDEAAYWHEKYLDLKAEHE